jgi:hypothetical protein
MDPLFVAILMPLMPPLPPVDFEKRRYTPASIFDGLHRQLDAEIDGERTLLHLQALDEEGWDDLQNGDIVELTGTLHLPDVAKAISAMQGVGGMLPLFKTLQESGEIPSDPESQMIMSFLEAMGEIGSVDSVSKRCLTLAARSPPSTGVSRAWPVGTSSNHASGAKPIALAIASIFS